MKSLGVCCIINANCKPPVCTPISGDRFVTLHCRYFRLSEIICADDQKQNVLFVCCGGLYLKMRLTLNIIPSQYVSAGTVKEIDVSKK